MACILHIETSTQVGSLSVSNDGKTIYDQKSREEFSHAASMGVFAQDAIRLLRKNQLKLDAVAVSEGPGSYTGLRIGVSLAKGLCFGLDVPLIAIPTLKIMATGLSPASVAKCDWLCPLIDARRMEVYSAIYDKNLRLVRPVQAEIIHEGSFQEYLSKGKLAFFGKGSEKCQPVIDSPNAVFIDGVYPKSSAMTEWAETAFANKDFVDAAYFEPFYLKEFQATSPKNKVIPVSYTITN
jgi:tRNA threonylcarbamoyladenosine biosynthesis protein TsaB